MEGDLNDLPVRFTYEVNDVENPRDWLSRLLEMIPVRGTLDYRCFLGAPWRIDFPKSEPSEIPYHVILGGSAMLEDPEGSPTRKLTAGDVLLFPYGSAHALHDGSDAAPAPARQPPTLNVVFRENEGTGDRLDVDSNYRFRMRSSSNRGRGFWGDSWVAGIERSRLQLAGQA